jgi:two-component system OmpR family response regulator
MPAAASQILCVDDEPAVLDMLTLCLRHQGFDVQTATDGLAACNLISEDPARFNVVITDQQMPRLSGIGLAEKLRAIGFPGHIVFFSSTLTRENVERLDSLQIGAVVEKGRPLSELFAAIRNAPSADKST